MRGNLLNKSAIMYRWQSGPLHRIANPKNRQFKSDPILQILKENIVAHKQQGILTRSPQWWKHLRDWKRVFWKSERQAQKRDVNKGE